MSALIAVVGALALAGLFVWYFVSTPPARLVRHLYIGGGAGLMAVGVGLTLLRRITIGPPLVIVGFGLFRRGRSLYVPSSGSGRASSVRTAGLDMTLDHDSGEMDGSVLVGRHQGRRLSELSREALLEVADDLHGDAESLRLLEAYLDRAHAGWREDVQADRARRQSAPSGAGGMSTQEAYELLGLQPGAGEAEVRAAHRRLMKQVHPDRGGSAALAARINEAKERILGKHR